jgi:hypothetical protein
MDKPLQNTEDAEEDSNFSPASFQLNQENSVILLHRNYCFRYNLRCMGRKAVYFALPEQV